MPTLRWHMPTQTVFSDSCGAVYYIFHHAHIYLYIYISTGTSCKQSSIICFWHLKINDFPQIRAFHKKTCPKSHPAASRFQDFPRISQFLVTWESAYYSSTPKVNTKQWKTTSNTMKKRKALKKLATGSLGVWLKDFDPSTGAGNME